MGLVNNAKVGTGIPLTWKNAGASPFGIPSPLLLFISAIFALRFANGDFRVSVAVVGFVFVPGKIRAKIPTSRISKTVIPPHPDGKRMCTLGIVRVWRRGWVKVWG